MILWLKPVGNTISDQCDHPLANRFHVPAGSLLPFHNLCQGALYGCL